MPNYDVVDFLNSVSKISNDLTEPINIYRTLEKKYIKANNKELLDSLYKEKKVIFSYLKNFEKTSLKQVKAFLNELKENVDLNEIKSLNSPKDINFVKIAYKSGKWTVSSKNLKNTVETNDVPTAIEYLSQIVSRLDHQDAAYSLLHAKNNGLFLIASLPDPLSENESANNLAQQRTLDLEDNSNYLGRYYNSSDGLYQAHMPVSLQAKDEYEIKEDAEENTIREGNTYLDKNEGMHIVTSVNNDVITFADNSIKDIEEVKQKIKTGEWERQAAFDPEKTIEELEIYSKSFEKLETVMSTINQMVDTYRAKLEDAASSEIEILQEKVQKITPEVEKRMKVLEEFNRSISNTNAKITTLKQKIGKGEFQYRPESEKYSRRSVSGEKLQKVINKMKELVSPKNIKKFENYEKDLYYWTSQQEMFGYKLDINNPEVRRKMEEKTKELKKQVKTSIHSSKNKMNAYNLLDKMIYAGKLDFNLYNELSDCVEINSEISHKCISEIYELTQKDNTPKVIEAGIFDSIKNKLIETYNKIKDWFNGFINFITIEDEKVEDLNNDLDELIGE